MSSRGFLLFDLAKESALGGAPFLSNDLNINRLASAIAAGFDSKGDLFPDAKPVIRQRGVVNVYIGTNGRLAKPKPFSTFQCTMIPVARFMAVTFTYA